MEKKINRHEAALLIKAAAIFQGRSQYDLALKCKIKKTFLNQYLNRHIDLLPDQIERLIVELGLQEKAVQLSALVGGLE